MIDFGEGSLEKWNVDHKCGSDLLLRPPVCPLMHQRDCDDKSSREPSKKRWWPWKGPSQTVQLILGLKLKPSDTEASHIFFLRTPGLENFTKESSWGGSGECYQQHRDIIFEGPDGGGSAQVVPSSWPLWAHSSPASQSVWHVKQPTNPLGAAPDSSGSLAELERATAWAEACSAPQNCWTSELLPSSWNIQIW